MTEHGRHILGPTLLALVLTALASGSARADGFAPVSLLSQASAATAAMNGQRAVLWHKGDRRWEVTIQVEYGGDPDKFAWVVPFPAMFTVKEGDPGLMDQLDRLTAPFVATYVQEDWGDEEVDSIGILDPGTQQSTVRVWQSGTVGPLGYDIVTASAPSDLVEWLTANEYRVPDDLDARLAAYIDQDYVFFCARIDRGAAASAGFLPVTFVFDDLLDPTYPMELTALSAGTSLHLTLWVISPSAAWLPANYDAVEEDGSGCEQANLVSCLAQHVDALEKAALGRGFSIRYLGRFAESPLANGLIQGRLQDVPLADYGYDLAFPVPPGFEPLAGALQCLSTSHDLGACAIETSGDGLGSLASIYLEGDVVTRLDGDIASGAMRDVLLVRRDVFDGVSNLWTRVVYP